MLFKEWPDLSEPLHVFQDFAFGSLQSQFHRLKNGTVAMSADVSTFSPIVRDTITLVEMEGYWFIVWFVTSFQTTQIE